MQVLNRFSQTDTGMHVQISKSNSKNFIQSVGIWVLSPQSSLTNRISQNNP